MGKVTASLLTVIFTFMAIIAAYGVISFTSSPSSSSEVVIIDVPPGSSFSSVARNLAEQDMIHNELAFKIYAKLLGYTTAIHVGEFELKRNMSPSEILSRLSSGKSITYPLTIPEGFNIFEITQAIEKLWPQKAQDFLKWSKDKAYIKSLLKEDLPSFEGYLFPDTYYVTKYMDARELIQMMVNQFELAYSRVPETPLKKQFTRHQIVTFASVIEKETGVASERPLISSVFHNRLQKGMRLQSDPTIIYGVWAETGNYLKNIQKSHILAPTPYNTYTVKALPVGPIANPGEDSMIAVVQPDTSEYLYFVSRNDGTHVFSKTLEDHNAAVKNFQLNRKAREGKSWRDRNSN